MNDFNEVLYSIIGRKLREIRSNKALSQQDLSSKIPNIGRTSISNIEKGKQFTPLHIIYQICQVLDIDVHSILPTFAEVHESVIMENSHLQHELYRLDIDDSVRDVINELINQNDQK